MTKFAAFLDACTLVPISQADTLLRLAECGLYRPLWSDTVLEETVAAMEKIHPNMKNSGEAKRRVAVMRKFFIDACVEDWQHLVKEINLPDPDDRHVVAAAFKGRADVIVTTNVKDFPSEELEHFNLSVQTPDQFLLNQLDLEPQLVMESLLRQVEATTNPKLELSELLRILDNCGAKTFANVAYSLMWRLKKKNS